MAKKGRNGEVAGKGLGKGANGSRIKGGKEEKAGKNVIGRCKRKKMRLIKKLNMQNKMTKKIPVIQLVINPVTHDQIFPSVRFVMAVW